MAGDEGGGRPILTGLVALVGVGLVVGALLSVAVLAGASILGLGGGDEGEGAGGRETLFIPDPSPTDPETGPLVTLAPGKSTPTQQEKTREPEQEDDGITLEASPKSVDPMERIDLTGAYPEGDGAILQVQRRQDGGKWENFPVDASVNNGRFQTWVQTGRPGRNDFRMRDNSSGETSNAVTVTIG